MKVPLSFFSTVVVGTSGYRLGAPKPEENLFFTEIEKTSTKPEHRDTRELEECLQIERLSLASPPTNDGSILNDKFKDLIPDWHGLEYDNYLTIPMYNGGKNEDANTPQIAEAKLAYDCTQEILCAAAYYLPCYLESPIACAGAGQSSFDTSILPVMESNDDTWVELGVQSDGIKLKQSSAISGSFKYVTDPESQLLMGYEGCWEVRPNEIIGEIQVHFNRQGQTTSTGKNVNKGVLLNLCGAGCPPKVCPETPCPGASKCVMFERDDNCECKPMADPAQQGNSCDLADSTDTCTMGQCDEGICKSVIIANGDSCTDVPGVCCQGTCEVGENSCNECPTTCLPPVLTLPTMDSGSVCALDTSITANVEFCTGAEKSIPFVFVSPADGVCGDYTLKWTSPEDCRGETTSGEIVVTVDKGQPVISLPQVPVEPLSCTDETSVDVLGMATAVDNCGPLKVDYSDDWTQGNTCSFALQRTWSSSNDCGSSDVVTQTIQIVDDEGPAIAIPPESTFDCIGGDGVFRVPSSASIATASDPCNPVVELKYIDEATIDACNQTFRRTWTAIDECDNEATAVQIIHVVDSSTPFFETFPDNITREYQCGSDFLASLEAPTGNDICYGKIEPKKSDVTLVSDTCEHIYDIERTWTVTDSCGLSFSQTQLIEVRDTTPPEFDLFSSTEKVYACSNSCVEDSGFPLTTADCGDMPTAKECDTAITVSMNDVIEELDWAPGIKINRDFVATDDCGNSANIGQTFQVYDDCNFGVYKAFSGLDIGVAINIINVLNGVEITVTIDDDVMTGDLRGVFFQVALNEGDLTKITIAGAGISAWKVKKGGVDRLSNDVLMKGGGQNMPNYDVGVEVGTPGKAQDDYQTVTFTVSGISTNDIVDGSYFGIRITSVGQENNREFSSKVYGQATCCRHTVPAPEDILV